jgi:hypothetical protein
MKHFTSTLAATILSASLLLPDATSAQQSSRTKVGMLSCDISAGLGLIVASKKELTCLYTPSQGGPKEVYVGSISKFGLDIGATAGGEMAWAVYAPTSAGLGALAGNYGGATAEATVGVGLGANVLVGGSNRTVSLQPISVQGQEGLNLAVGVTGLELRRAR